LVAVFSPSLWTSLLAGKDITPYGMMMNIISSERYEAIRV
jgi:hypothetical protein